MSKINDLMKQYCPDGVEWKELGNVCKFQNGFAFKSEKFKNFGENTILRIQNIQNKNIILDNLVYFDNEDYKNTNLENFTVKKYDVIIAQSGATAGKIAINNTDNTFYLNQRIGKFIPDNNYLLNKFLYYFIDTKKEQILNIASSGGAQPNISGNNILSFQIPLPPLPVQQEIVNILDKFTELEAELEAELEGRKKQYEHYRNTLLTFGDDVEWKELGEIATFEYGYTAKANDSGNTRFIRITDINSDGYLNQENKKYIDLNKNNEKYILQYGDIIVARTGATYGKTLYINSTEPSIYASYLIKIVLNNTIINNKYYWHFTKSNKYWNQANKLVSEGGQPQFNANVLSKIKLPVPPLPVQEKIVAILDKFDKLVNDIKEGLPAEIALRRKQYEFYRNKLLDFKDMEK